MHSALKVPIPSWLCGAPEHHTLRVSSPRQQPYAQNCHSDHSSGHGQDPISSITMCVVCIMSGIIMFFATPLLELITITLASGLVYIKGKSRTNLQYPHM